MESNKNLRDLLLKEESLASLFARRLRSLLKQLESCYFWFSTLSFQVEPDPKISCFHNSE